MFVNLLIFNSYEKDTFLIVLLAIGLTATVTSCSSSDDTPSPFVPSGNSLAGQQWTLVEGDETSVYTFLTETAMSVLVSPNLKAVAAPTTYVGTYSYDKAAVSATFRYNGRTRQLTGIAYAEKSLSSNIDGVPVTMTVAAAPHQVIVDKEFLESTAKEFVGLFNQDQFRSYTSIYNALEKSNANAVSDELEDVIDKLMKTTVEETSALKHYRYILTLVGLEGEYKLGQDKKWYWTNKDKNVHRIIFNDDNGRQCVVNVTTLGQPKEVYFYKSSKKKYNYDTQESYTKIEEYRVMLPEKIQATVTRDNEQLMLAAINIDLGSIEEGQKIDPSSDSFGMDYTLNIKDLVDISAYTNYVAQGESKAGFTVVKNGRVILSGSAIANTKLQSTSFEDFQESDKNNLYNASFNIDVLGKIQLRGTSNNMSTIVNALDAKTERYSYESVKSQADRANSAMNITMFYNGTPETRGYLNFGVDSKL